MRRGYLTIIITISLHSFLQSQTVVIARKTKDAIYVGEDTKIKTIRQDLRTGAIITDTFSRCKLWQFGNFNVAFLRSDLAEAMREAEKTSKGKNSIVQFMRAFIDSFSKVIYRKLAYIKSQNVKLFLEIVQKENPYSEQIFFGLEKDSLFLSSLMFSIVVFPDSTFAVRHNAKMETTYAGGHAVELQDLIHKPETWTSGEIKTINELIKRQQKLYPDVVNTRIDIIKVTKKDGAIHIQKSGLCN